MKHTFLLLAGALLALSGCNKDDVVPTTTSNVSGLSVAEAEDLNFLIQEEKLARDVYLYAYQKHGDNIFNNIASSEQSHMDQVAALLEQYNLTNPVIGLGMGEFENATLQQMYYDLTAIADNSSVDGFTVGATIEDLDINDIDDLYANTNNPDLLAVYDALTCGSRNHMRSFYDKLVANGVDYTPQYISEEEFEAIVTTAKENCN